MPTYEYVCKSCGHLFEIIQSMRDDPLTECPECGGELRKVFAPPAIAFKGSGFYATDHGKKSKQPAGTKESSDASSDGKGSEDKSSGDKGSGDKGSGDKGRGEKGSGGDPSSGTSGKKPESKPAASGSGGTGSSGTGGSA